PHGAPAARLTASRLDGDATGLRPGGQSSGPPAPSWTGCYTAGNAPGRAWDTPGARTAARAPPYPSGNPKCAGTPLRARWRPSGILWSASMRPDLARWGFRVSIGR